MHGCDHVAVQIGDNNSVRNVSSDEWALAVIEGDVTLE